MEFSSFENAGRGTPASDLYHSVTEADISNYIQRFANSSMRAQGFTLETADDYEMQVNNITKNLHQSAHLRHGLRDTTSNEKILARSLLLSTKEENESIPSKNKMDSLQRDYWSQKSFPINTKSSWSEQNSLKSRLSPSEIDHSIEEQINQFAQPLPRKPKVAYFDITQVQSTPTGGALREQLEKLQHDNIATKLQLEKVVRKYEDLSNKFKDCQELKNKNLNLARRYEEQLKDLNKNYCTLQKENKELLKAKLPKKAETPIIKNSPKASKERDELREKLDFLKNELVASKEGEKNFKLMYQEQVQLVNYLNEKYEKDTREKDFLMTKNIELIERFGKLQQNIKENTAPDSQERAQYSQQNTQILELQKVISRLECQNFALRKRNDELTLQLEAQESLKTEEEAIKLIEKSGSVKDLDLSKRPESTKNSRNPTETFGDENKNETDDSSFCTFITKNDKEYQSILSSYNPLDDEALNTIKIELEGKLAPQDFQMIEMLIDKHIDTLRSSLQSTELVNRYNKLLINYFKALDKLRMSTKTKTIHLQKVEMQSDFSNTTPHSQNIQDFHSPKNFTNFTSLQHTSLPTQEDLDSSPFMSIKKQIIQPKLLIDVKSDLLPEYRLNKSHSLEGQKITSLLSNKEKPSKELESFASNPNLNPKKILPRSVSASKTKNSYRDIYNQRKKEIVDRDLF